MGAAGRRDGLHIVARDRVEPVGDRGAMKTSSVLINNYNNGRYLAACIDSVLAQTRPADEIIVYDDGSTDDSLEILRGYGHRIVLIEGVHNPDRSRVHNHADAVFRAFERSSGEWLFLLDGDDAFVPHKIERTLRAVEGQSGVALVQAPMRLINGRGEEIGGYRDPRFHCRDVRAEIYRQNDVDFFYPTSALVVHRTELAQVLPLDMSYCTALACDTRIGMLMPLLGRVITLDEHLTFWRRHAGSFSGKRGRRRWNQVRQTLRRVRTFNIASAKYAAPPISLWKNRRFRRQIVGALLPGKLRLRLQGVKTRSVPEPLAPSALPRA